MSLLCRLGLHPWKWVFWYFTQYELLRICLKCRAVEIHLERGTWERFGDRYKEKQICEAVSTGKGRGSSFQYDSWYPAIPEHFGEKE